jgi:arylsulfatase
MDRGLRDGDWKAVSFRGEAWELYNMAEDRAELHNLAETEPDRVKTMLETWTKMARDVLHAPPKHYAPAIEARLPHRHPQWTQFDGQQPLPKPGDRSRGSKRSPDAIRARKNTQLTVAGGQLQLRFTGDDPGVAMDLRGKEMPGGPYLLSFRLLGGTQGGGEVFYTTDSKTTLPRGERVEFDVPADEQWRQITLVLPANGRLYQLRIDVSDGPGTATIADLTLADETGNRIISWP